MKISMENTEIRSEVRRSARTGMVLKKSISAKVLLLLMCLTVGLAPVKITAAAKETDSAEEYLAKTGMSVQEIETLDSEARQFIADDLKDSDGKEWKVNTDILTLTKTSSEQYTVAFYINVFAFQAESDYRIYAVYESSTGIMPAGDDSLSLRLGDGFAPYEYGGQTWYKRAGDESWTQGGGLTADRQTFKEGVFSGRQMGNFQRKMLVKGCVFCYAHAEEGSEKKVTVEYTYKPSRESNEVRLYILIVAVTVIIVLILRKKE